MDGTARRGGCARPQALGVSKPCLLGQAVASAVSDDPDTRIAAGIDLGDSLTDALEKSQTVIDFTLPSFTDELIEGCLESKLPLVMGTTGHDDKQLEMIQKASEQIPIVHAPNYSVGVNTLFWLTRKTTEILGDGFDLEVVEMHHRHKKDSPSGTARRLAEILAEAKGLSYDDDCRHGRFGDVGARVYGAPFPSYLGCPLGPWAPTKPP